ncbi:MAG: Ca-activated chloride channel [Micromonosporaceae bacterium]|nr:Ca-activated chloride channel [Micromonosporaceae bacterium]
MSFQYPIMIVVSVAVCVALVVAYRILHRERTRTLAAGGLRTAGVRQHVPPVLFLAALTLLLLAVARPQATVKVPRAAGTVILAFDVSNSMTATDAAPSRLGAARAAANRFVRAQPGTVDIGVVAFDQGALTTRAPTKNHEDAVAAIDRLRAAGGTSLGQAILASLTTIVGRPVSLPDPAGNAPPADLGYWGSATIVLLSDGEDTGGPDAVAAAELAAAAGVHVYTIGFGTADGTTIEVDGYQVATALNDDLLTAIAQATAASYHRAGDARTLDGIYRSLALRITAKPELVELTGAAVGMSVLFLTIGGLLMINWFGRIL